MQRICCGKWPPFLWKASLSLQYTNKCSGQMSSFARLWALSQETEIASCRLLLYNYYGESAGQSLTKNKFTCSRLNVIIIIIIIIKTLTCASTPCPEKLKTSSFGSCFTSLLLPIELACYQFHLVMLLRGLLLSPPQALTCIWSQMNSRLL